MKSIFYKSSNRWTPCSDIIKIDERIRQGQKFERIPRRYQKKNEEYWDIRKSEIARSRVEKNPPKPYYSKAKLAKMNTTALKKLCNKMTGKTFEKKAPKISKDELILEIELAG